VNDRHRLKTTGRDATASIKNPFTMSKMRVSAPITAQGGETRFFIPGEVPNLRAHRA